MDTANAGAQAGNARAVTQGRRRSPDQRAAQAGTAQPVPARHSTGRARHAGNGWPRFHLALHSRSRRYRHDWRRCDDRTTSSVVRLEACPPGGVLVIDTGNNARSASAGDLMIGRLKVRGCAGIVTDGGFRDIAGVIKVGLPAYQRRASPPATPIGLHSADLDVPIGCAGRGGLSRGHRSR